MNGAELLVVKEKEYYLNEVVSCKLKELEAQKKELEKIISDYRTQLQKIMEDKNIVKLENDDMTIIYKDSYDVETFDKTKFKKENQDLYDQYVKMSTRKPSLMIKFK